MVCRWSKSVVSEGLCGSSSNLVKERVRAVSSVKKVGVRSVSLEHPNMALRLVKPFSEKVCFVFGTLVCSD